MRNGLLLFLKGLAMGAANVIPGVSGGTIALVTGIYERLIFALKSIDAEAVKLALRFDLQKLWVKIDAFFLSRVLGGVAVSILSLARLFEWLLEHHEVPTMGFFFGLILASVFYVGRAVSAWCMRRVGFLVAGIAVAVGIALLVPVSENANPLYVFACGALAVCSMILPGLSGSFVLILMGNYALVLRAINTGDLGILIPLALGCGLGLLGFAQLLGWLFKRFHNETLALMSGFVVGSLLMIWPWKIENTAIVNVGDDIKSVVTGYSWQLPELASSQTWSTLGLIALGAAILVAVECLAGAKPVQSDESD